MNHRHSQREDVRLGGGGGVEHLRGEVSTVTIVVIEIKVEEGVVRSLASFDKAHVADFIPFFVFLNWEGEHEKVKREWGKKRKGGRKKKKKKKKKKKTWPAVPEQM